MESEAKESSGGDVDLIVHVAVGRDVKEGKMLLSWAVKNLVGRNICLLYVHKPTNLTSLLDGKLSLGKFKDKAVKACQEFERLKMRKLTNPYFSFLSQMGMQAEILWTEMSNVAKGILQLIDQHGIKCLVMGTSDEKFQTKLQETIETNSSKAMAICQQAPPSCQIFFISNGRLIHTRHLDSQLNTTQTLLSSSDIGQTTLVNVPMENMDSETETDPDLCIVKAESSDNLTCSSSRISLDSGPHEAESLDMRNELNFSMIDTENSEHKVLEDSLETECKTEASESLGLESPIGIRDIEELIAKQKQELKIMQNKHDELSKNLQLIQDQKSSLESQLREAHFSEKELEEKIIQAVNLLVTFKETRDKLQTGYDAITRKINKCRISETTTTSPLSFPPFFGISFSDIIEATDDFNPSHKIGEGRYGCVFKGILSHVKVVIKMLPSCGSQSDSEFKEEVEALCRVRHPNLVTLIGACIESRSLIYEYVDGITLEDCLSKSSKFLTLSWQTRIRITTEISRLLLFLHANYNSEVHGNINLSNILLDSNLATKVCDFGIHYLIPQKQKPSLCSNYPPEKLAYVDPDSIETGKFTTKSDVYSFGSIVLRLLTSRPVTSAVRDVGCALATGNLETVLDMSAGDWPLEFVEKLADLALRCCEKDPFDRPDLASEIWPMLEQMRESCNLLQSSSSVNSSNHQPKTTPSHFVCPIFQEVMQDPHIAADGFTYEGDAIRGWFNSGHKTSPMTNLKLENCDLIPNYALFHAIQEWEQNYTDE